MEKEYPKEINESIDKLFPKGDKRRGDALVLQAVAFLAGKKFALEVGDVE
jgi:NADPH-dependent glutamate synthase beta subunit-like oxidoreductase